MQRFMNIGWLLPTFVVVLELSMLPSAAQANVPVFLNSWGSYGTGYGQFYAPAGIAVGPDGDVYVATPNNHNVQRFSSDGQFEIQWGEGGSGTGQFSFPKGIAVSNAGVVYVADTYNNRVQLFDANGAYQGEFGGFGSGNGQFNYPNFVAVNSAGQVYVTDTGLDRVQRFNAVGGYELQWGSSGNLLGQFSYATGVAVADSGQVYVAEYNNSRVQRFAANGTDPLQWGTYGSSLGQFNGPYGVAVSSNGLVYVADANNTRIQRFNGAGVYQTTWGSQGYGAAEFWYPQGVAVTGTGLVYIADTHNNRIQRFLDYEAWVDPATHVVPDSIEFDSDFQLDPGMTLQVANVTSVADSETGTHLTIAGGALVSNSVDLNNYGILIYEGGTLDVATLSGGQLWVQAGPFGNMLQVNAGSTFVPRFLEVYNGTDLVVAGGVILADQVGIERGGTAIVSTGILGGMGIFNQGQITLADPNLARLVSNIVFNQGTLRGSGKVEAPLSNELAGTVRVVAGERLQFPDRGWLQHHVNSGRIEAIGNLQFGGPAEIEFADPLTNRSGTGLITARNATLRFNAGLINEGSLAFSFGTSDVFGDITNTGTISLGGGAEVTFYDDIAQNGSLVIAKVGSTISKAVVFGSLNGGFTGGGDLFALGDLQPGNSPATVTMGGNLFLGPSTNTIIELGGMSPGVAYDQLIVTGELALAGKLDVSLIDLGGGVFQPGLGNVFEIASATAGITGSFATEQLPDLGPLLDMRLVQQANDLFLAVLPALTGDYNANGVVDAADYVVWRKTLYQTGPGLAADGNGNGSIDNGDFGIWRAHFGQTAGSGAGASANADIPEPATLVLIILAAAVVSTRRRWEV